MGDTGQGIITDQYEERALTPLDPAHIKMLRLQAAIAAVPFAIGSLVLESANLLPMGAFFVPFVLAAAWLIARVPLRRHAARGYDLGADRLRVVRGLLFRSDTVVPFGRVQHIDVTQGPLERIFGLATLIYFAQGRGFSIAPGSILIFDSQG